MGTQSKNARVDRRLKESCGHGKHGRPCRLAPGAPPRRETTIHQALEKPSLNRGAHPGLGFSQGHYCQSKVAACLTAAKAAFDKGQCVEAPWDYGSRRIPAAGLNRGRLQ